MIAVLCILAALTAAAPKAEIRNVRISSAKLFLSRERADSDVKVAGRFKVEMAFARESVRKPVMRLACLSDLDGRLVANMAFLSRPDTAVGMSRAEILAALKRGQPEAKPKELDGLRNNPAKFTPFLAEVAGGIYASGTYGSPELNCGFFRLGKSVKMPKLLQFRIEVWQNGVLVAQHSSARTGLAARGVPEDWHVWGKYPQKLEYADVK